MYHFVVKESVIIPGFPKFPESRKHADTRLRVFTLPVNLSIHHELRVEPPGTMGLETRIDTVGSLQEVGNIGCQRDSKQVFLKVLSIIAVSIF